MVLQVQQFRHNLQYCKNLRVKYICIWRNILGICFLKIVITSVSALQGFRMSSWQQFWLPSQICVAKSLNWRLIMFALLAIPRCFSTPSDRYGTRSTLGTCLLYKLPGLVRKLRIKNVRVGFWSCFYFLMLKAVFYLLPNKYSERQTEGAVSVIRRNPLLVTVEKQCG